VQVARTREAELGSETSRSKRRMLEMWQSRPRTTSRRRIVSTVLHVKARGTGCEIVLVHLRKRPLKLLATRVEKVKLRRVKMKDEKSTKNARQQRVRQEEKDRITHKLDAGRRRSAVRFFLEGFLIDAEVADTGADATVVPESLVNKLDSRGLDNKRIRLEKPIVFHSAKANGIEIVCATKITVKKLSMEVRGVQVVFKNATMMVKKDIDELLMGSDILKAVGFPFAKFLEKNATDLERIDLT
jgi:predicted aspartyl protease